MGNKCELFFVKLWICDGNVWIFDGNVNYVLWNCQLFYGNVNYFLWNCQLLMEMWIKVC